MCLAVPGKILSIDNGNSLLRSGRVSFGGVLKSVNLAFVPEAEAGQYVLVHAGVAINTIDEKEANRIFADIEEMMGEDNTDNSKL